jgi:hypothetical protein
MYVPKKVRTQLYLTERQRKILAEQSLLTGKSAGELVREAVEEVYLKERRQPAVLSDDDPLWNLVGSGSSRQTDISARHDDYLYPDR